MRNCKTDSANLITAAIFIFLCFSVILVYKLCTGCLYAAEPQKIKNAAPGNCIACHGSAKDLPAGHVDTSKMDMKACLECHKKKSLSGKIPLGHIHALSGISCDKCHGNIDSPKPVMKDTCLRCHGTAENLASKTSNVEPNPHNNPHQGMGLECGVCHHQHKKSDNHCNQCHSFDYRVP